MKPEELLSEALDIAAPWQITRTRNDLGKRQIDIWVGTKTPRSGWFFGNRTEHAEYAKSTWRHINIGNSRCVVHAMPLSSQESEGLSWLGEDGQQFSRALARQIAGMFMEGIKFQSICSILDIPVADLWKFKHSLDSGKAGLSVSARHGMESVAAISGVPETNDAIWENLLDGSLNIDIRVLSLKLLLTKLREQMRVITDSEVRIMKTHELQRYFVRHEHLLGHELAQLARLR